MHRFLFRFVQKTYIYAFTPLLKASIIVGEVREFMWNSFERDKEILFNQYSPAVYNEESGQPFNEVRAHAIKMLKDGGMTPAYLRASIIKYALENLRIGITPEDFFPDRIEMPYTFVGATIRHDQMNEYKKSIKDILDKNEKAQERLYYTGDPDYSHTAPHWTNVLSLGI